MQRRKKKKQTEDDAVEGRMETLISWNTVTSLWVIFCLYWVVSALRVKRTQQMEAAGRRFGTVAILVVAAFLIFARRANLGILSRRFTPQSETIKAASIVLVAVGVAIAIWARRHIGEYWSSRVALKKDHHLIQSGPYARVRHPIYSGMLLAMIGTGLFVGEWRAIIGVLLVFAAHWQKARREEKLLASEFGPIYQEYCGRTGSLIPRLH
jgi:protein-S-isoprenylcysteine O-methyltransferase Ste14